MFNNNNGITEDTRSNTFIVYLTEPLAFESMLANFWNIPA